MLMRVIATAGVGVVTAVVSAIGLAIVDLYLSGHGYASIRTPLSFTTMSLADLMLVFFVFGSMAFVWRASGRRSASP